MIVEDWEDIYQAQAVWGEGPSADEIREKIKDQMPAYQLETGLEGGVIIKPRHVLYVEVKGITSAILTAQSLAGDVRSAGINNPKAKVNGKDLPEIARRFSIGIKSAIKTAKDSLQKELKETLRL